METIRKMTEGKHVLFISTKNKDYIRNQQEIRLLKQYAGVYDEIVFQDKSYIKRIVKVWLNCFDRKHKKAVVIFVGFAPQLLFLFLRKWKKNKDVIIDFFVSFYDTCVCDRKYFKEGLLAARALHWLDEITLEYCSCVVADTYADARYFSEEFHVAPDKITVYYLEADKDIFNIRKYQKKYKNGRMIVLYFGSILPLQGVEVILEAVKLLKNQNDIEFIMIGPVDRSVEREYKKDCPNVKFYRWLSQKKLAEQIAQADLCLAGHFNAEIGKAKRTIPGKAYIYEAMKKKMILGDSPANRELFSEDEDHIYVKMGNARKLADKIMHVKKEMQEMTGGWRCEIDHTNPLLQRS